MAKFTKKYVRKIKRRRNNRKKAKKLSKPMRKAVQKIVNKSSERKVAIEVPVRYLYGLASDKMMYSNDHEILCELPGQRIVLPASPANTTQYISPNTREGLRVERASFKFKCKWCWDTAKTGIGYAFKAQNVNSIPMQITPKIFVRFIAWQPKLFQDVTSGKTYLRNIFGPPADENGEESTTPWTNIYAHIDPTQITVLKDSGAMLMENLLSMTKNFYFNKFYKSLRYEFPTSMLPDDRRPILTVCQAADNETQAATFMWIERSVYFHDA